MNALRAIRKGIQAFDEGLAKVETALLVLVLTFMVGLAFVNIVGRTFEHGILWAEPVLKRGALYLTFLGASLATRERRHINIDIMSRVLPRSVSVVVGLVVDVAAIAVCVVLTYASIEFIGFEKEGHESPFWGLPNHQVTLIIPIGFGIMAYRFGVHFVDQIIALITREDIDYGSALPAEAAHIADASDADEAAETPAPAETTEPAATPGGAS